MAATGVRVTHGESVKVYPAGRAMAFDGYGDLIISDATGHIVATRKRGTWDEIEIITDDS